MSIPIGLKIDLIARTCPHVVDIIDGHVHVALQGCVCCRGIHTCVVRARLCHDDWLLLTWIGPAIDFQLQIIVVINAPQYKVYQQAKHGGPCDADCDPQACKTRLGVGRGRQTALAVHSGRIRRGRPCLELLLLAEVERANARGGVGASCSTCLRVIVGRYVLRQLLLQRVRQ